jgi:hypothetical protein
MRSRVVQNPPLRGSARHATIPVSHRSNDEVRTRQRSQVGLTTLRLHTTMTISRCNYLQAHGKAARATRRRWRNTRVRSKVVMRFSRVGRFGTVRRQRAHGRTGTYEARRRFPWLEASALDVIRLLVLREREHPATCRYGPGYVQQRDAVFSSTEAEMKRIKYALSAVHYLPCLM